MCSCNCFLVSVCLIPTLFLNYVNSQSNSTLIISLSNYNISNKNAQSFDTTAILNDQTLQIDVTDVKSIKFFIIQIHSFQTNTVLSYNLNFFTGSYVSGTNIGLVQNVNASTTYSFFIKNQNTDLSHSILVAVIAYQNQVPVPGGCNMEFLVQIAPYQSLTYTDNIIIVDSQAASIEHFTCDHQLIQYDMYHLYLPEQDYLPETYFKELRKMLTVDDIQLHGTKVFKHVGSSVFRTMFNVYQGTGSIYVTLASYKNKTSAYVPIVTYACDALNTVDCDSPSTLVSKILCAVILFIGLFTCFYGHRFFKTEMFLTGALVGGYLSYIALSFLYMTPKDIMISSLVISGIFGMFWLVFWCIYGIPVISILLLLFVFGNLVASITFYSNVADMMMFQSDLNFWSVFVCITLLCVTFLVGLTHRASILACSIIGAYVAIIPIDNYVGSNLKYIFINTIRRITIPNFGYAVINPPFQFKDKILVVVWLTLAVSGLIYQLLQQRGKPPFPPPSSSRVQLNERTALLYSQHTSQPDNLVPSAPPLLNLLE